MRTHVLLNQSNETCCKGVLQAAMFKTLLQPLRKVNPVLLSATALLQQVRNHYYHCKGCCKGCCSLHLIKQHVLQLRFVARKMATRL